VASAGWSRAVAAVAVVVGVLLGVLWGDGAVAGVMVVERGRMLAVGAAVVVAAAAVVVWIAPAVGVIVVAMRRVAAVWRVAAVNGGADRCCPSDPAGHAVALVLAVERR
jgi:hypothetical protein